MLEEKSGDRGGSYTLKRSVRNLPLAMDIDAVIVGNEGFYAGKVS